ncbi:MAG: DUF983 domain-containing protein [Sediminibacterium sp.]|nr:DUF983 domain-containing protein [Sediminibacterium sp.]
MILPEVFYSTVANKCPRCHKGKVFSSRNPYNFSNGLHMNERCSKCDLKYEREPGFFYGALYVSYALMSGIFILWFVSDLLWLHMETTTLLICVITTMLVSFPLMFRWARTLWLNFFVRYDKTYSDKPHLIQNNS